MAVKNKLGITLLTAVISSNLWGSDQIMELPDGRKVILHDDFTWQYIAAEPQANEHPKNKISELAATPIATPKAIPITPKTEIRAVTVEPGNSKNIQQISQSGVDVLLRAVRYENNKLIIPVGLTNQSTASIIKVVIKYKLLNSNQQELASGEAPVWSSIKRMANTYFRPKTQQEGKDIVISVPKSDSYLLQAEVIEVETR